MKKKIYKVLEEEYIGEGERKINGWRFVKAGGEDEIYSDHDELVYYLLDTVCEYTGLEDSEEAMIFSGDIVEVRDTHDYWDGPRSNNEYNIYLNHCTEDDWVYVIINDPKNLPAVILDKEVDIYVVGNIYETILRDDEDYICLGRISPNIILNYTDDVFDNIAAIIKKDELEYYEPKKLKALREEYEFNKNKLKKIEEEEQ